MRSLALVFREITYAQRTYWRNRSGAFFTFAFPIVMLVLFASMLRGVRFGTVGYAQYVVPGMIAFGVISACYTSLAIRMCFLRDLGVLRRIRGTPLPLWIYLAGSVGSCVIVSVALAVLMTAIGVAFYDVPVPRHLLPLGVALAVGSFCFCTLGFAVTVLVPSASAAGPIVNGILFPVLFLSGIFFPPRTGSTLESIGRVLPVRYFQEAVAAAFNPLAGDGGLAPQALVVMLAWGAAGLLVAVRTFRWEPPRH